MNLPQQNTLTPTEKQIAELLLQGYSRRDIAEKMGSNMKTLRGHLSGMYSKLAVADDSARSQLIRVAVLIHEQRTELGLRCEACEDP